MLIPAALTDWCTYDSWLYCVWEHQLPMNVVSKGTLGLLALMFVLELAILYGRASLYAKSRKQSRRFVRDVVPLLDRGRVADALETTRSHPHSHIARVTSAGLSAFLSAPLHLSHREALALAQ